MPPNDRKTLRDMLNISSRSMSHEIVKRRRLTHEFHRNNSPDAPLHYALPLVGPSSEVVAPPGEVSQQDGYGSPPRPAPCDSRGKQYAEATPPGQTNPTIDITHAQDNCGFANPSDIAVVLLGYLPDVSYLDCGAHALCFLDGVNVFKLMCVGPPEISTKSMLDKSLQAFSAYGKPVNCISSAALKTALTSQKSDVQKELFLSTSLVSVPKKIQHRLDELLPKNLRGQGYRVVIVKQPKVHMLTEQDKKTAEFDSFTDILKAEKKCCMYNKQKYACDSSNWEDAHEQLVRIMDCFCNHTTEDVNCSNIGYIIKDGVKIYRVFDVIPPLVEDLLTKK